MDPEIIKVRKNLNTFTLEELKKEVIKMKHLNFALTGMKRNQVIQLIINYRFLFPHLMNKIGTKRHAKPKTGTIPPANIQLPPQIIQLLQQPVPAPRTRDQQPVPIPRARKQQPVPIPRKQLPNNELAGIPPEILENLINNSNLGLQSGFY